MPAARRPVTLCEMQASQTDLELAPAQLRREQSAEALGFASTEEVEAVADGAGSARAVEAIAFGLRTGNHGYNVFVTGPVGSGRDEAAQAQVRRHAQARPAPPEWVYLHNFAEPRRPIAVALPVGSAAQLAADMRRFVADARRELVLAFDSEEYARRRAQVTEPLEREQEASLSELRHDAQAKGVALDLTPAGIMTVPLRGTHPLSPAEFAELPEPVRARYQASIEELGPRVEAYLTHLRTLRRQGRDRLRELEQEVAQFAIGHLMDELKERYAFSAPIVAWLDEVAADVTEHLAQFQDGGGDSTPELPEPLRGAFAESGEAAGRYEVNVFVAHESGGGAPVVVEDNPTYPNVFGRIEHRALLGGGLITDHRMLRPGALHRANGGYLILPADQVLAQPLVWLKLKEVLRAGRLRLENPADQFALFPTATLVPEPIDLDVKIVLVGRSGLYELAYELDEDVRKLFRVKAELDWRMRWDDAGAALYAGLVSEYVRENGLPHFDAGAVARVIEFGARLAEDRESLSTNLVELNGLVTEASHWAREDGDAVVTAAHVVQAIERRDGRSNLLEQRLLELIDQGALMIDLGGARIGQVNGLSVVTVGDYAFGHPVRVTAAAGPGRGTLLSLERETELSGHIHDKGFLTLSGYLRRQYGATRPIALAATLSFEQSYAQIDGDSAASTELYALLSAIAEAPLAQGIAVTGSVNQAGELQPIGGVNEKIEGFHRACRLDGLTGEQGVIIPAANVRNLMLDREVVDSVRAGRFHVWAARTIDDAMELLAGMPAGVRQPDGTFPADTLHARCDERMRQWAEELGEDDRPVRSDGRGAVSTGH